MTTGRINQVTTVTAAFLEQTSNAAYNYNCTTDGVIQQICQIGIKLSQSDRVLYNNSPTAVAPSILTSTGNLLRLALLSLS